MTGVEASTPRELPRATELAALFGVPVVEAFGRHPAGVRVVVNGAGPGVFRQAEMEAALAAGWSPEAVAGIRQPPDDLLSDIHGGAEYRAHLVTVMARRAVLDAG